MVFFVTFIKVRKLLFIFIIFFAIKTYSQVTGTKFAPDSTYWKETGNYWVSQFNHPYVYINKYIVGDTVIGNKYYQKMYQTYTVKFDTICLGTLNLLHYDSCKLYLNNKLVYNFNLVPGDTINLYFPSLPTHPAGYYTYTVTVRDSINIGNKWRKQLTFSNLVIPVSLKWVEGVGDLYYGLAPSYPTIDLYKLAGGGYSLSCFSEHFQNTYGTGCGVSGFCGSNNLTSTMPCSSVSTNINFSIYGGTSPYTFTIQTPFSCLIPTYTVIATTTNPTFTLGCAGVYTITVRDVNNASLGITTHTTSLATNINLSVSVSKDTICSGESTTLSIINSTPNYTVNPINWNDGSIGSPVIVSPSSTYTYSLNGLYTTANSRTCTASGTKKIVVNNCVGINEYEKESLKIYPNPVSQFIYLELQNPPIESEIEITNYLGQTVLKPEYSSIIDVSKLSQGIYTFKILTKGNQNYYSKFVKE